ncbi:MAG: branched-chain amino acid ABC transporter permease [Deltaproteobacteria bacterium]|nr:branched-chain amino acid ABC transporter permease [Deltaproteobacteria bacterium]
MRFIFKTNYNQDIKIYKHSGYVFWYTLLIAALLIAPLLFDEFMIGELSLIYIYSIAALSLMVLMGYTGLPSFGHAGFMAIGAFTQAYLVNRGVPFLVSFVLVGVLCGVIGALLAIPLRRATGIYFAIGTLAFAIIVENTFKVWNSFTGGIIGTPIDNVAIFGHEFTKPWEFYYLCLIVLVLVIFGILNLLRSHTGRALVATRDSEISALCMGININKIKIIAFGVSGVIIGLAGALFAHKMTYIAPEVFSFIISMQIVMMVVIGGLGSVHGAVFGAIFLGFMPTVIAFVRDFLPSGVAQSVGLMELGIIGIILILFILFEPNGLYGRWLKIKLFLDMFPMYRKATYKRQKSYLKTERVQ